MPAKPSTELSRRERQIMEVVHSTGEVTAAGVRAALQDQLSDSAVRTFLRILEQKGHLRHREENGRYLYKSVESPVKAKKTALRKVLDTFFGGSLASAAETLVEREPAVLNEHEILRLERIIHDAKARQQSRNSKSSKS